MTKLIKRRRRKDSWAVSHQINARFVDLLGCLGAKIFEYFEVRNGIYRRKKQHLQKDVVVLKHRSDLCCINESFQYDIWLIVHMLFV